MHVDPLEAEIGLRVRTARTKAGLTQAQLAERVGLARTSIVNIENGRQGVSASLALLLSRATSVGVHELFPGSPGQPSPVGWELEGFAGWLEAEALRIKTARERLHGGTRNRHDLIYWADALQWAARKARERAHSQRQGTSDDDTTERPAHDGSDQHAAPP